MCEPQETLQLLLSSTAPCGSAEASCESTQSESTCRSGKHMWFSMSHRTSLAKAWQTSTSVSPEGRTRYLKCPNVHFHSAPLQTLTPAMCCRDEVWRITWPQRGILPPPGGTMLGGFLLPIISEYTYSYNLWTPKTMKAGQNGG